ARTPKAMGRSNPGPSLRMPAGDRLTTTLRSGQVNPELSTAGRTRSRASWIPAPGRPVSVRAGNPRPTCASTEIRWPRTPTTATANTRPYTGHTVRAGTDTAPGRRQRPAGTAAGAGDRHVATRRPV